MQPTTVYVESTRTCCVSPALSVVLGIITGALFVGAYAVVGSYNPSCDCDITGECCTNSEDSSYCDEDNYNCFCIDNNSGREYCKTEAIKEGHLAGFIILLVLGVIFLIFASMSCCCYHKLGRRMAWVPVTGRPTFGVISGPSVGSAPPESSIQMTQAELTKA